MTGTQVDKDEMSPCLPVYLFPWVLGSLYACVPKMDEPFWRVLSAWEKQASAAWAEFIRSPEFIARMNQQLEECLLLKRVSDDATDQVLQANGLATRAEQARIQFLVRQVANEVEELEERVERIRALAPSCEGKIAG